VTARVELEEELRRRASHDELTGLLNRRAFTSRLTARLDAGRPGRLGVLFVDLDDFKAVNDTAGHVVGDALLVEVARRLCAAVRTDDLVARFGGDEFVALIEGSGPGDILAAAERLRTALSGPYDVASEEIATRASIGVAVAGPAATADELLRNADLAMYRAKAGGRDRTELYVPEMHAEAVHRFALAGELRHAVEAELLELRYQPIVDLADGHVRRLEALLRWRRPDGTEVAPGQFVPIAEQAGLIVPLSRWVLREALREVAGWRLHGLSVGIAVNLSARQLDDPDLVDDVARALAEHGVPACALLLEVTENVLVDNLARSSERLAALRALGVGVALDDFGTGFSSLGYLSRLPVDVLKVDRSFVAALGRDEDGAALVRTIMALAADLRLETVAEGVETPAQLETLRALGYHSAQGFVFARPQPADAVEPLVRAGFGTLVAPVPACGRCRRPDLAGAR
jgi:diguanylate cyclase (GGDEF)-like protein